MATRRPYLGLVLSGGGARGAYEAGVLAGIAELRGPTERMRFDVITGTSVGAMNAAHIAAHVHREDGGIPALLERWMSLDLATHVRPTLGTLLGWGAGREAPSGARLGRALLDPRPFEALFGTGFPWDKLHDNIRSGRVRALIVSALNVANGRTVSFVELAPAARYFASRDPRRDSWIAPLTADHVLASAAIPLIFPARRLARTYFCDGGLRFNTPMAPAIRAGADRLLVVALRAGRPASDEVEAIRSYPNPVFLLGKIFDALLLDPIEYDLQVLERLNRVLGVLEDAASPVVAGLVGRVLEADRGIAYRRIEPLVFRPSKDLGVLALEHFRKRRPRLCAGAASTVLLEKAAALGAHVEADFLSYILFDRVFAKTLIDLGREDVRSRASEVNAFFEADPSRRTLEKASA
jgi:NTE family protein